jgi:aspartate kinase
MEQAIRRKIPIRIKNVENPGGGGTVIHPDVDPEPASPKLSSLVERKRLPTAVTIKEHIIVLNVNSNRKSVSHGFLAGIFGTLDRFGVVVDLISTSEVYASMAIEDGPAKKFPDRLIKELKKSGTVSLSSNCRHTLTLKTLHSGLRPPRDGHPFVGREADAQDGRYCREDVLSFRAG